MASIEDTVTVPAEQYADHVPDDHESDEIEIGLTAFSDKLYIKFPRFERRGTNDFCMSADSILSATIEIQNRRSFTLRPVLRQMNVLREKNGHNPVGGPEDVSTAMFTDSSEAEPEHLALIEEVTTTISGFRDDEYWKGYKRGANVHGDEMLEWTDVAWECFDDRWDGNKELLLDVGKWFAREGVAVCSRSKAFFPIPEWSTPTGSYVATISDVHAGTCPECGADKDEYWECYSSSNRTRVPNKYKCTNCGHKRSGITTG